MNSHRSPHQKWRPQKDLQLSAYWFSHHPRICCIQVSLLAHSGDCEWWAYLCLAIFLSELHKQFGSTINSIAWPQSSWSNKLWKSLNVTVLHSEINAEIANVEQEASSSGGLQAVLEAQKLTMDEFKSRVESAISCEEDSRWQDQSQWSGNWWCIQKE